MWWRFVWESLGDGGGGEGQKKVVKALFSVWGYMVVVCGAVGYVACRCMLEEESLN
tara:strand:+ start:2990 stop:3157 length:168 start_codon:yes stop_codon:yes gene_type:complete